MAVGKPKGNASAAKPPLKPVKPQAPVVGATNAAAGAGRGQAAARANTATTSATATTATNEEPHEDDSQPLLDRFTLLMALPSFLISLIVHVVMLIVAALIFFTGPSIVQVGLTASNSDSVAADELDLSELELSDTELEQAELTESIETMLETPTEVALETPEMMDTMPMVVPDVVGALSEVVPAAGSTGDAFSHRSSADARQQMLKNNGGTAASEEAVELGLKWIAAHQLPDGSWDLNHQVGPGRHRQSPNPGKADGRFGATGLALLPFLGKGYTHTEGPYQKTVRDGLAYLIRNIQPQGANGGSYMDGAGSLYSHAICTIVLCEAFGMTLDSKLHPPANAALHFIVHAQDPIGGGWRYRPQQPGDTSVVGWQLMALKSGNMMGIAAPPVVFERTKKFLNSVQADGGAQYRYLDGRPAQKGPTAVGVLSRMYMDWKKDHPTLEKAVAHLGGMGPDTRVNQETEADMYYNYYATQVMRHYGGQPWEKWNGEMRDFLIENQAKEGYEAGSWYFSHGHASEAGGRLYSTSMAVMTLEVYYRHLPLYKMDALEDEFPLD
ncbi:MAG: terpene cyclase/mutase family protein [Planctomycetaceae bacterium]|nr:terpene cyclase/mutase family protein [Planctomycetaceae bacterium]